MPATITTWNRKHQSYRPATPESLANKVFGHSFFFRPLSNSLGAAIVCHQRIASSIAALRFLCSPNAIVWTVALVVILPLQGVLLGSLSHIGKEVFKGQPAFTDCNPSPSIVHVCGIFGVSASPYHSTPSMVLWLGIVPVSSLASGLHFTHEASTASTLAANQTLGCDRSFNSAVTTTPPPSLVFFKAIEPNYRPSPDRRHRQQVFNSYGQRTRLAASHVDLYAGLRGQSRQAFPRLPGSLNYSGQKGSNLWPS